MQLTNEIEEVTHVLVGAKESGQFSMEESAAFFDVLSKSLYSDPMLAAIREPICNAWDAHIAAGKTDVPIAVSVSSEGIVIRDFGYGIAHEDINNLYCRYGKSTKKDDDDLTGGFGVGCKAPYAYADHFEVTSYHNGTARVYAMSRHPETNFPTWNLLAEVPSEETGLQVSIPSKSCHAEFQAAKHAIASGSILATLNGVPVPTLDFSDSPFALIETTKYTNNSSYLCVQYGSVLYRTDSQRMRDIFQKTGELPYFSGYMLCIKAPAGSLSIPPSREALRDTEQTQETIKELVQLFLQMWGRRTNKAKQLMRPVIREAVRTGLREPGLTYSDRVHQSSIDAWEKIALVGCIHTAPLSVVPRQRQLAKFNASTGVSPVMRRKALWYLEAASRKAYARVIKIALRGGLDITRLYACTDKNTLSRKLFYWCGSMGSKQAPTITITTRKEGLSTDTTLVYKVARKGGDYQKALDVFNKAGFAVIDMVPDILAEPPKQRVKAPKPGQGNPNTAKRGLPTLRNLINTSWDNALRFSNVNSVNPQTCARNAAPKFVVYIGTSGTASTHWLRQSETLRLLTEYADDGVYATTTEAYERWKKKGVPTADTFLAAEIEERLLTPPATLDRLANQRLPWRNEYTSAHSETGFSDAWPTILEAVGIPKADFTLADPKDAALWRWCQFGYQHTAASTATAKLLAAIQTPKPTTPEQEALAGKHWFLRGVSHGAWYEWMRAGKNIIPMIQTILQE
jgi:hypothetical protein